MDNRNVLTVVAHPDDEILGCGGTVALLKGRGYDVYTLILGEGVASRYSDKDCRDCQSEIRTLKDQISLANSILGVKEVFTFDFPDNRFDSVDLLDIVKRIEEVKGKVKPCIVFTHFRDDLNVDHRITFEAVLTATRPQKDECVDTIYSFEVLSSTEWNYPLSFSPNVFFDISGTIDCKMRAMRCYSSELRDSPHPRSLSAIENNARMWGAKNGVDYAEAFNLIRQKERG